jgi:hypothetical protein
VVKIKSCMMHANLTRISYKSLDMRVRTASPVMVSSLMCSYIVFGGRRWQRYDTLMRPYHVVVGQRHGC